MVAQAGDGGTVDIGFGCLSGMFERNDDVLFVCYDNEAYMNTGVQRSGATPPAARTATTEAVGPEPGNAFGQGKDLPRIAMAHDIPYVATATVADLHDLEAKVEQRHGPAVPATSTCWSRAPSDGAPRPARRCCWPGSPHETGIFPVFEARDGDGHLGLARSAAASRSSATWSVRSGTPTSSRDPPRADVVARIQAQADTNIARYGLVETDGDTDGQLGVV